MSDLLSQGKLWLAPLAGYTDQAFRTICKTWGADVLVSEMVSADGLVRDSKKTEAYLEFTSLERPFGIQLFGSDPVIMAKAAEQCLIHKPDFIDINMGCPVKKVVKRGAGSALMLSPDRASSIVKECKKALGNTIPLSVKFRSGWDNTSLNYLDFGLLMQDSGADFLCLHPRTQKQGFSGVSNWKHIKELKEVISVPLIGNGDVIDPESAFKLYSETGCDSIMIGRGALGKPWIFSHIKQYMQSNTYDSVLQHDLRETILKHIDLAIKYKGEYTAIREMRGQICSYSKGLVGGAELRRQVNQAKDADELVKLIEDFFSYPGL